MTDAQNNNDQSTENAQNKTDTISKADNINQILQKKLKETESLLNQTQELVNKIDISSFLSSDSNKSSSPAESASPPTEQAIEHEKNSEKVDINPSTPAAEKVVAIDSSDKMSLSVIAPENDISAQQAQRIDEIISLSNNSASMETKSESLALIVNTENQTTEIQNSNSDSNTEKTSKTKELSTTESIREWSPDELKSLPVINYENWQQINEAYCRGHLEAGSRAFLYRDGKSEYVRYQLNRAQSGDAQWFIDDFINGLRAAGINKGTKVFNAYSMMSNRASFLIDEALGKMSCVCLSADHQSLSSQAVSIASFSPEIYVGSFAQICRLWHEHKDQIGSIKRAVFFNESISGEERSRFQHLTGIENFALYGSSEVGCVAYEIKPHGGFIVNPNYWIDIVYPGSAENMPFGEVGEAVISRLKTPALSEPITRLEDQTAPLPVLRIATGNLACLADGFDLEGMKHLCLKGFMGKIDVPIIIGQNSVCLQHLNQIRLEFKQLKRLRFIAKTEAGSDSFVLHCENPIVDIGLTSQIEQRFKELTGVMTKVRWCDYDTLPRDGRWLEDRRSTSK